ncbi:hypothetical protein BDV96DRAFT_647777 [Lophiotrema nucula]|uniref:Erythromycin biosynthesis protein CIII-like C-terminal domain-containing protein n=1 Tax=Lophiotrema nucula TaxID=690887 RepID=A0A6A5Z379_9PLEO|nr:hypothetical protein BDV96DRAFT_647777 [Lophiotrema nucula]
MAFIQRLLSLGFVPIVALLALQIFAPVQFHTFQEIIDPYIANTPLSHFLPSTIPLRSETPIFIASVTHWSHLEKIAAIAVELASLGYPITFLTGRIFENHVSKLHPNIKFSAFLGLDDKLTAEDYAEWARIPPGPEQELWVMKKVLMDGMADNQETIQVQFREFKERYGNEKPLIFMADQSFSGHWPVLLGAPGIRPNSTIGISIAPLTLESNHTYPFRSGKVPETGPDAKEKHWKAYQDYRNDVFEKSLNNYYTEKLRELGATDEPFPSLMVGMNILPDKLLQLGVPGFEFSRPDATQDVRYFGAFKTVGKSVDDQKIPVWWDDIANAKKAGKKIIAVSQGTVETNPEDLVLPTIEALKDRDDVLLVATFVTTEPEEVKGLGEVPANTRVAKFVPYDLLLPMVDILVSNGGYGAVQHCLRLGIPMVVSGLSQDKATTNSLVEHTGVGLNLGKRAPSKEKIGPAVVKLIEDESFKKNAAKLSKEYENYDVGRVTDGLIREVVRDWAKAKRAGKQEL